MEKSKLTGNLYIEDKKELEREGKPKLFIIKVMGFGFGADLFVSKEVYENVLPKKEHKCEFVVGSYEKKLVLERLESVEPVFEKKADKNA